MYCVNVQRPEKEQAQEPECERRIQLKFRLMRRSLTESGTVDTKSNSYMSCHPGTAIHYSRPCETWPHGKHPRVL